MPKKPKIPYQWPDGQKSTPAEEWAWDEIQAGRIADFNRRYKCRKALDPQKPKGWGIKRKDRRLSAAFLETILTKESFRKATPYQGVRIAGARFDEAIDLEHARLERQLWLENCWLKKKLSLKNLHVDGWFSLEGSRHNDAVDLSGAVLRSSVSLKDVQIKNGVNLTAAKIRDAFSMEGSTFDGKLNMNGIDVGQHLLMQNMATSEDVDLTSAKIGGHLSMKGSTFNRKLNKNGAKVVKNSFVDGEAIFQGVNLGGAKIGNQVVMTGSIFKDKLNMNGIDVGRGMFMDDKATFQEVDLTAAKIGGGLFMDGGIFNGKLTLESVDIGGDLFARGVIFPVDGEVKDRDVNLMFATIGASLGLSGATIAVIDLTGTTIGGELRLGSPKGLEPTKWVGESNMILRNTTVGAIQDADPDPNHRTDSWPENLELEGFTCSHLGGYGAEAGAEMAKRQSEWFIKWLEDKTAFSPHPYEMFANLLRKAGYPSKANDILYAGRERARAKAWEETEDKPRERWRWFGMGILNSTIGYGLGRRYFWALWWVLGFTYLGFSVLWTHVPAVDRDAFALLWASFDWLLPLVELDKSHGDLFKKLGSSELAISNWGMGYFYIHKMVGYVLASFLIAGLAGLTQKS